MAYKRKKNASKARIKKAMKHKDVLGAGAKKRRKTLKTKKEKVHTVMKEFKRGTLHSGSGAKVTNPKQAIAIALGEPGLSKKKKKRKKNVSKTNKKTVKSSKKKKTSRKK